MALDPTILVRAGNMDEAKSILSGYPDGTTPNTPKGALIAYIDGRLDSFRLAMQADYPPDYATFFTDFYTGLKSDIDTYMGSTLPDNVGVSIDTACDYIKDSLVAYETANGLTNPCPKCQSSSFFTGSDGVKRFCDLSNGYTQTAVAKKVDLDSVNYIDV